MNSSRKKNRSLFISMVIIIVLVAFISALSFIISKKINDKKNLANTPSQIDDSISKSEIDTSSSQDDISHEISFEETEIIDKPNVKIMMVGDDLLHLPVVNSAKKSDGSYNFDHIFKNILPYTNEADVAIINQETILGGPSLGYSEYPQFNSPFEVADAISNAGFDVVTHANNHAMDMYYEGIRLTLENWDRFPDITVLGINKDVNDYEHVDIQEINGIKIAFLSYTFSTNGIDIPSDKPWLVDTTWKDKARRDFEVARKNADFIIVLPHWGNEYVYKPNSEQLELAKFYNEQGADLIIGTHPHVLQPVEWIESSETGKKTLVYYSLGNFISTQNRPPRMLGGMAKLTIEKNDDGKLEIVNPEIIPLVTHYEWGKWDTSYTTYPLKDYTEELASKHGVKKEEQDENGEIIQKEDFSIKWLNKMCQDILGDEWFK